MEIEMYATRRDFIKNLGISIASLVLTRCASQQYSPMEDVERLSSKPRGVKPSDVAISAFNPTANTAQEPTAKVIERQSLTRRVFPDQKQPMTTADWLECDPCNDPSTPPYRRLRQCWENLNLVNRHLFDPNWSGGSPREMLIDCHVATLKELVEMGELSQEGSQEIHEAFLAAINYVLTNSIPMVCYD
jgi:hypothetical protein